MPATIKEVILENFMSYKYSRIPFKPGLNIITGPNGSGKSSILLGISVALGQTYTERGRRLSDLIRRGEDVARVTVVLDNSPIRSRRPLPWFRSDEVYFTRYIRSDGQYWHEINGRSVPKIEVYRYLSKIGLNPDNMLIIMHQNMIEEFAFLSAQEKLRIVEDAIGLRGYRSRIVSALEKLEYTKREEEKVREMLAKAEEALSYWREMHDKYLRRRKLEEKLQLLKREKAWIMVRDREKELAELAGRVKELRGEIESTKLMLEDRIKRIEELNSKITSLENNIINGSINLENGISNLREKWMEYANLLADKKLSEFKISLLERELDSLSREEKKLRRKIRELKNKALEYGARVESSRSLSDVEEDLRQIELSIAALGTIPENVVEAFEKYSTAFEELSRKAEEAALNRKKALEELEKRINIWRQRLVNVISEVAESYRWFLQRFDAVGDVKLVNLDDFANAGLELTVGFKGLEPALLDPYTQSGGERSTAIMCFLLALQSHIKSPLRAIDEFDVHMDPSNRAAILDMVIQQAKENKNIQYILITPGPMDKMPENANIILVQKVKTASSPSLVG
ncbi:MAG: AAA family ATPase [Thermoproteales archaeon]|nr:AAA family ATPase [Thermoproteales archaeon]